MRVKIVEEEAPHTYGRIQELEDSDDITGCFICAASADAGLDEKSDGPHYCSSAHKKLHFPEDQDQPFPFLVKYRSEVGRYMVAARDIAAGEVIFTEEPLAVGPNHTALPCCLDCMKLASPGGYACPKCNLPVCEEMCAFGEEHTKECSIFAGLADKIKIEDYGIPHNVYWSITILRVLHLRDSDPERFAMVQRMMDHNEEHAKKAESWSVYEENVVRFLREKCKLADKYSAEEIFHVLGVLDVNSIKVNTQSGGSTVTGHGLYALTSLLSHSCISNSKTVLKPDYSAECKATVFIPQGEEITKQYVSPLETTQMRREKLRQGWYFECKCWRCIDPSEGGALTSATRCLRCGEGTILANDPLDEADEAVWKCDTCGFATKKEAVDKLVHYFLQKLRDPQVAASVEALEDMLEKSARLLNPSHYIVNMIRISMNSAYIQLSHRMFGQDEAAEQVPVEVYMRRKDLLDDVHKVIELVDPGLTRRRGNKKGHLKSQLFAHDYSSLSLSLTHHVVCVCRPFSV